MADVVDREDSELFTKQHFEEASALAAELRQRVLQNGLEESETVTGSGIRIHFKRAQPVASPKPAAELQSAGASPHGTTVVNVPSRTYKAGNQPTLGPQTLTADSFSQMDIQPTADLPAGVTVAYSYLVSKSNGVFESYMNDSIIGPMPLTDADGNPNMDIGTSTNVPPSVTWKAEFVWSTTGGSWTTGFTITETAGPYLP